MLIPVFVSPMVLAFGYVVALGPVGFFSYWAKGLLGFVPWNLYSLTSIAVIAGLTHVPHVYLYSSAALREPRLRRRGGGAHVGANPLRVALDVSLPMVLPALSVRRACWCFSSASSCSACRWCWATPRGTGAGDLSLQAHQQARRAVLPADGGRGRAIVAITVPLVFHAALAAADRRLRLGTRQGTRAAPLPLGVWRWPAFVVIALWLPVTVIVPLFGIALRSFVEPGAKALCWRKS